MLKGSSTRVLGAPEPLKVGLTEIFTTFVAMEGNSALSIVNIVNIVYIRK